LRLSQIDPSSKEKHETSETVAAELEAFRQKLTRLQALLYAAHKHSLLIVLQAMDAGGKDGTVNHVFAAFNAQGTTVTGWCIRMYPALARLPYSTARTTRTC
jgi:polyphosphate kinase 2 (PPK2 family)